MGQPGHSRCALRDQGGQEFFRLVVTVASQYRIEWYRTTIENAFPSASVVPGAKMLRDWKKYVIHQAKFLGARRGEYSGVRQSDSDASSKATCALHGEEASISRARLQIFACSVAAVLGVILGISLGSMSLKLRECNQNISQAHEAYGHKGILPRSKYSW